MQIMCANIEMVYSVIEKHGGCRSTCSEMLMLHDAVYCIVMYCTVNLIYFYSMYCNCIFKILVRI